MPLSKYITAEKIKHILSHRAFFASGILLIIVLILCLLHVNISQKLAQTQSRLALFKSQEGLLNSQFLSVSKKLTDLENVDQVKRNNALQSELDAIKKTYYDAQTEFENLTDFKDQTQKDWPDLDKEYALSLSQLSEANYSSASATLASLDKDILTQKQKIVASLQPPAAPTQTASVGVNNSLPSNGYSRQNVQSGRGTFLVDIVAADLSTNKIIVDTASSSDCTTNCPVLPLSTFVARSGAWAGINGPFFCPTAYPSCAGKTNSFDTLLMNKNKYYFNSANNVYSTIPAAIFSTSARFVDKSMEWGRDTGVDSVIANYPLLVQGGSIVYSTNPNEPKFNIPGTRCFIASKGNTVYIGVVYNATMDDAASVLKTLGVDNALNLDEGGSTAFWVNGGYKAGPGRDTPFGVLIVKR